MTGAPVDPSSSAATRDEDAVRQRWHDRDVEARIAAPDDGSASTYVIHGGPPAAAASADIRALALRTTVDVVARHRAMCGAVVVRVLGHTGAQDRADAARSLSRRLGCLPGDEVYRTTDPSYVDSVWWAVGQLWDAGLLREAHLVTAWCPRCAAAADDRADHVERADAVERGAPSALVRFPVTGDNALRLTGASLLVEVTAPWTLPAVTAVRVDPDAAYVLAQAAGDDYPLVLARSAVAPLLGDGTTIHRDVAVDELLGLPYRPVTGTADPAAGRDVVVAVAGTASAACTGLAPLAPGCGGEDLQIARDHDVTIIDPFGPDGRLDAADGRIRLDDLAEHERAIVAALRARGLVVGTDEHRRHERACRTCGGAAVERARPTWMITTGPVAGAPAAGVGASSRSPGDGAGHGLPAAGAAGGVPLPLWRCTRCRHVTAVDSRATLSTLAGRPLDDDQPHVALADDTIVPCQRCGGGDARWVGRFVAPSVAAAAAPFARFGFPALPGSDTDVAHGCHADLVVDGSVRAGRWAEALRVMSLLLWNAEGVDATLCVGAPGRTRVRASAPAPGPDAAALIARYGADAVRCGVLAEPTHADGGAPAAGRRLLHHLRAACDEHVAAAGADGWQPFDVATFADVDTRPVMDRWVLAELSDTVAVVRARLDGLDPPGAGRRIRGFVDDLHDWYLARTRPARTVAGEPSRACRAATHATLHECLVTVAALLAPFAPFTSDELYERLVRARDPAAPDSVHLLRYPTADPTARNDSLRDAMRGARRIVATGERGRRQAGIAADRWIPRAAVTAPPHARPYWTVLRPLIGDALRVTRIDHVLPGTPVERDAPPARWHVTRDGDTAVALPLPGPAADGDRPAGDLVVSGLGAR